jgi:hypothetical protein
VLLDPVPVEGAVVLAAVSPGRRSGSTNIRIERAACCWVRIGSPTMQLTEPFRRPDCAQAWRRARDRQGQALSGALARVLDCPCARRQLRCAGRDEETAAQPNKETGQPGLRDRRSTPHSMQAVRGFSRVDEGNAASRPGVPVPIPTRCREVGNGNWEWSADQGFVRR